MRRRPSPRGQSIVEFALILPVFLYLLLGVVDIGRVIFYQSLVNNAARDAARYALAHPDQTCSSGTCGVTTSAQTAAGMFGAQLSVCSATLYSATVLGAAGTTVPPACPNSNTTTATYGYVTVVVSVPFQPATALFTGAWTRTLSAQSTMLFRP